VDELVLSNDDLHVLRRANWAQGEISRGGLHDLDAMRAECLANSGLFERRQRRYVLTCFGRRVAMEVRPSRLMGGVSLRGDRLNRIRDLAAEDAKPFKEVLLSGCMLHVLRLLRESPYLPFLELEAEHFDCIGFLEAVGFVENVDGMIWLSPLGMLVLAQACRAYEGGSAAVRVIFGQGESSR
jgi:hypothetical protein